MRKFLFLENIIKSFILNNYNIDYSSFYHITKNDRVNNTYRNLTDNNKVIGFKF